MTPDMRHTETGSSNMKALLGILALIVAGGAGFYFYTTSLDADIAAYAPPPTGPIPDPVPMPQPEAAVTPTETPATDPTSADPAVVVTEPPADVLAPVTDIAAMPAPPAEQLLPITPLGVAPGTAESMVEKAKAIKEATTVPLPDDPVLPPPTDMQKKTADTVKAVNDILGEQAIVTPEAQQAIAKQVEVTPRASEVIIVKKTFASQSGPAMNAAGGRVLEAGNYNEAAEIFDTQLKKNPSDPIALSGKAEALQRAGRDAEAMAVYERLIDLNPRDVGALTNYLGALQKQNPEQALVRLQDLSTQHPESATITGQLAMVQARLMDTPNALRSFQKAATLDPTNPTYPFNMAVLYDRLGTVSKARESYRTALGTARAYPEKAASIPLDTIRGRLRTMADE
jgi:Flp pilus assembly protein TadD